MTTINAQIFDKFPVHPEVARKLRIDLGVTHQAMAETIGLKTRQSWINVEFGKTPLTEHKWHMVRDAVVAGEIKSSPRAIACQHAAGKESIIRYYPVAKLSADQCKEIGDAIRSLQDALGLTTAELSVLASPHYVQPATTDSKTKVGSTILVKVIDGDVDASTPARIRATYTALTKERDRVVSEAKRIERQELSPESLKALRDTLKISQNAAAAVLFPASNRPGAVLSQYENGSQKMRPEQMLKLHDEYVKTLARIVGNKAWETLRKFK